MNLQRGFRVGRWEVYPLSGEIRSGDDARHLEPKVMEVFVVLAEQAGDVVRRDELVDRIWGARAEVADEPLTRCVAQLRRALGDSSPNREYVKTIPTIGYSLLQPVEPLASAADAAPAPAQGAGHSAVGLSWPDNRLRWLATALAVLAVVAIGVLAFRPEPFEPPPNSVAVMPFIVSDAESSEFRGYGIGIPNWFYQFMQDITAIRLADDRNKVYDIVETTRDVRLVAAAANTAYVVGGELRLVGDVWLLTYELFDFRGVRLGTYNDDEQKLSASFDDLEPVFRAMCRNIVLGVTQDHASVAACESGEVEADPRALRLLMLAQEEMRDRDLDGLDNAVELLREAIDIDPDFGGAYVLFARAYSLMPSYGSGEPKELMFRAARAILDEGADRAPDAVASGRSFVDAYMSYLERDLPAAHDAFERALNQTPRGSNLWPVSDLYQVYSQFLSAVGRPAEALAWARMALNSSPRSPVVNQRLAMMLTWVGEDADASAYFLQALDLGMSEAANRRGKLVHNMRIGEYDEVGQLLHTELRIVNHAANPWIDEFVTYFKAREDNDDAVQVLKEEAVSALAAAAEHDSVDKELLFGAWLYLEEWSRAIDVGMSVTEREDFSLEILFSEDAEGLRQQAEFAGLLDHFGLWDYWSSRGVVPGQFCSEAWSRPICDQ